MTPEEAEDILMRYEGGVRSADRALGRLLGGVDASDRPWLVIVTADHGESLGEDGRWFHGHTLAPELLAVPLVVGGTGVPPGRFHGAVGFSAITDTLAAAAGLPHGPVDLRRDDGPGFAQGGLPPNLLYLVEGAHKLVYDRRTGQKQLFDRARDTREWTDIAAAEGSRVAALAARLAGLPELPPAVPSHDVPAEQLDRLKALGYTAAGPAGSP